MAITRTILHAVFAATAALTIVPAEAKPDAWTTRDVQILGTFVEDTRTYRVRATFKRRSLASVGDPLNPQGGVVNANPMEESSFLQICADACTTPGDIRCSVTTAGIVRDDTQTVTVDSTATSCPVSFTATISGYGVPRLVASPTGTLLLQIDANAVFAPGATIYNKTAAATQGLATRTIAGLTAAV